MIMRLSSARGKLGGIILTVFLLGLTLGMSNPWVATLNPQEPLSSRSTTNPTNPEILEANIPTYDYYYMADANFYYKTLGGGQPTYCIWLNPYQGDDCDLYVYGDADYTALLASSDHGAGELEWVVLDYDPALINYYVRVHATTTGSVYLEYDPGMPLSAGATATKALDDEECVEVWSIYLGNSTTYDITLIVPPTGDYDLFLYRLPQNGVVSRDAACANSTASGLGVPETIGNFSAGNTPGYHAAVVVRRSGNGTCSLSFAPYWPTHDSPTPAFPLLGTLLGLVCLAIVMRRHERHR